MEHPLLRSMHEMAMNRAMPCGYVDILAEVLVLRAHQHLRVAGPFAICPLSIPHHVRCRRSRRCKTYLSGGRAEARTR
jgi:hypothetical protein